MREDLKQSLKMLLNTYTTCQKDRISTSNRLRTLGDRLLVEVRGLLEEKVQEDKMWEMRVRRSLEPLLMKFDEWLYWMKYVKGLGSILAAKYLAIINWDKVRYPSSLYMYFGLICDEKGRAYRVKRGEKAPFDRKKKAIVYNTVISFMRRGEGYKRLCERIRRSEDQKARFTVRVKDLDPEIHVGHLWVIDDDRKVVLVKNEKEKGINILKLKKQLNPNDEIVLERTPLHRFNRMVRRVGKVYLGHMVMFHYWFNYNKLVLAYPLVHVDGHGSYVYMPVLDVPEEELYNNDIFNWWHTLYDAIKDSGRKPVVL